MHGKFFAYALAVKIFLITSRTNLPSRPFKLKILSAFVYLVVWGSIAWCAAPQQNPPASTVKVTKVEPPNWWLRYTPEVMLLLTGQDLEATHVSCNLPTLDVSRTQATAGGNYLFV
ncbi:MAG TPA: cyclomaltodextrinase N-terminal domain-containing protein, partial [Candidatus Acidoferrum sp.]|nr:cyclomaltodextrinase N-terminal domain-containing protein [Candidatus Acidoferrum sp.]